MGISYSEAGEENGGDRPADASTRTESGERGEDKRIVPTRSNATCAEAESGKTSNEAWFIDWWAQAQWPLWRKLRSDSSIAWAAA